MIGLGYLPVLCTDLFHHLQFSVYELLHVSYPIAYQYKGIFFNFCIKNCNIGKTSQEVILL